MFHAPHIVLDGPLKTYSNMDSQLNDGYTNYKPQNINISRKQTNLKKIDLKDKQTFKNK